MQDTLHNIQFTLYCAKSFKYVSSYNSNFFVMIIILAEATNMCSFIKSRNMHHEFT